LGGRDGSCGFSITGKNNEQEGGREPKACTTSVLPITLIRILLFGGVKAADTEHEPLLFIEEAGREDLGPLSRVIRRPCGGIVPRLLPQLIVGISQQLPEKAEQEEGFESEDILVV